MTETLILIGALSLAFAILCGLSDWAIPRLILLRRRRRLIVKRAPALAAYMREEWQ